jgi:hypothetical protein
MFSYYVFYGSTEKLARVHVGHCRHCNHGEGPSGRRSTRSRGNAWSGPFATREKAVSEMESLNLKTRKSAAIAIRRMEICHTAVRQHRNWRPTKVLAHGSQ